MSLFYIYIGLEKVHTRLKKVNTVMLYFDSCKKIFQSYQISFATHILTASTKIAANIKVMVIEVTSVIRTIFSCSSEIIQTWFYRRLATKYKAKH